MKKAAIRYSLVIFICSFVFCANDLPQTVSKLNDKELFEKAVLAYEKRSYKSVVSDHLVLAKKGIPLAQHNLGVIYSEGHGVERNHEVAVEWFSKAAKAGFIQGQFIIGMEYLSTRRPLKRDPKQARKWFSKAAKAGHVAAQYQLGVSYSYNEVGRRNCSLAVKWLTKAAEAHYVPAYMYLAHMYETRLLKFMYEATSCVEVDDVKAAEWYLKAARAEDVRAQVRLGVMYDYGLGLPHNKKLAAKWYRKAAEFGNRNALNNLGDMYAHGDGVSLDFILAVKCYHLARSKVRTGCAPDPPGERRQPVIAVKERLLIPALAGNVGAQFLLAEEHLNPLAFFNDEKEAFKWMRKAAEAGFVPAQFQLAEMLELDEMLEDEMRIPLRQNSWKFGLYGMDRRGGTPKQKLAKEWYSKAAENGDFSAFLRLEFGIIGSSDSVAKHPFVLENTVKGCPTLLKKKSGKKPTSPKFVKEWSTSL